MASVDGQPAVFDPAVYYGHSEAEFGMSWCAGFGPEFYDAYFEELPKQPGFETRRDLYLVYHYLVRNNEIYAMRSAHLRHSFMRTRQSTSNSITLLCTH